MNGDAQRFKALLQEVRSGGPLTLPPQIRGWLTCPQIFVPSVCVTYTPDAQQLLHEYAASPRLSPMAAAHPPSPSCYGSSSFARLCEPWCLTNRKGAPASRRLCRISRTPPATVHTLAENVGIELSDFAIRLVDLNDVEKSEDELDAQLANKVGGQLCHSSH